MPSLYLDRTTRHFDVCVISFDALFLHKVVIFLCTFSEEGRPDFWLGKTEARFTTFFAQLTFEILQLTDLMHSPQKGIFCDMFEYKVNCKTSKVNCAKKVVNRASVFPTQKSGLPSSENWRKKITTLCKKVRRTK